MKPESFEVILNHGELKQLLSLPEKPLIIVFKFRLKEIVLRVQNSKEGLFEMDIPVPKADTNFQDIDEFRGLKRALPMTVEDHGDSGILENRVVNTNKILTAPPSTAVVFTTPYANYLQDVLSPSQVADPPCVLEEVSCTIDGKTKSELRHEQSKSIRDETAVKRIKLSESEDPTTRVFQQQHDSLNSMVSSQSVSAVSPVLPPQLQTAQSTSPCAKDATNSAFDEDKRATAGVLDDMQVDVSEDSQLSSSAGASWENADPCDSESQIKEMNEVETGELQSWKKKCSVCLQGKTPLRILHRFPRDPYWSDKWAKISSNILILESSVKERFYKFRICSDHFRASDYDEKNYCLLSRAVPAKSLSKPQTKDAVTSDSMDVADPDLEVSDKGSNSSDSDVDWSDNSSDEKNAVKNKRKKCTLCFCRKSSRRAMHRFPTDPEMSEKWAEACDRNWITKIPAEERSKRGFSLCGAHFNPSDYFEHRNQLIFGTVPSRIPPKPRPIVLHRSDNEIILSNGVIYERYAASKSAVNNPDGLDKSFANKLKEKLRFALNKNLSNNETETHNSSQEQLVNQTLSGDNNKEVSDEDEVIFASGSCVEHSHSSKENEDMLHTSDKILEVVPQISNDGGERFPQTSDEEAFFRSSNGEGETFPHTSDEEELYQSSNEDGETFPQTSDEALSQSSNEEGETFPFTLSTDYEKLRETFNLRKEVVPQKQNKILQNLDKARERFEKIRKVHSKPLNTRKIISQNAEKEKKTFPLILNVRNEMLPQKSNNLNQILLQTSKNAIEPSSQASNSGNEMLPQTLHTVSEILAQNSIEPLPQTLKPNETISSSLAKGNETFILPFNNETETLPQESKLGWETFPQAFKKGKETFSTPSDKTLAQTSSQINEILSQTLKNVLEALPRTSNQGNKSLPLLKGNEIHSPNLVKGKEIHSPNLMKGNEIHSPNLMKGNEIHSSNLMKEKIHSPNIMKGNEIHSPNLMKGNETLHRRNETFPQPIKKVIKALPQTSKEGNKTIHRTLKKRKETLSSTLKKANVTFSQTSGKESQAIPQTLTQDNQALPQTSTSVGNSLPQTSEMRNKLVPYTVKTGTITHPQIVFRKILPPSANKGLAFVQTLNTGNETQSPIIIKKITLPESLSKTLRYGHPVRLPDQLKQTVYQNLISPSQGHSKLETLHKVWSSGVPSSQAAISNTKS